MAKISATIITDNNIATIERCLESIIGIADEIIVVDAFSDDGTAETCERYGCKVRQRRFDGFGAQKQYAVSLATNSYVLSIDADEYLDDDLRHSIAKLKEDGFEHRIYSFSRLNFFCGKPIRHSGWWPDKQTRLFDKRYGSWELRDVHEYEADEGVLNQGIDATKYQLLLVKKAVGSRLYSLANSFNHSKLKKRITMMLKRRSNKWGRLKLALLIPVGLAVLSAFARPETEVVSPPAETTNWVPTPSSDKGTALPQDDKGSKRIKLETRSVRSSKDMTLSQDGKGTYTIYLSFTKTGNDGKEQLDGVNLTGVEDYFVQMVKKQLADGRFAKATKVIICPNTPQVPQEMMQQVKTLFDAENIPCEIATAQGYDKDGNKLPPPPPPPTVKKD